VQYAVLLLFTRCTMALPQHKTCLSILRSILGPGAGGEARFAKKIGRSTSWLKKASCGQIPLTRDAAIAIAYETGASVKWLLEGDTTEPLLDSEGKPYTLETYANYRRQDLGKRDLDDIEFARDEMTICLHQLLRSLGAANLKNRGGLFTFHLRNFVDEMADKFGVGDIYQNEGAAGIAENVANLVRKWDAKKKPLVYAVENNKGEVSAQINMADIHQNLGADGIAEVDFLVIKGDARRISPHNLKPQKKQPSRKSKRASRR
jgi:hypothetical protein